MVRNGQRQIPELAFQAPVDLIPGFEIIDVATLHARRRTAGVHRIAFHTLTLFTRGEGEHAVDFTTYPCRPGTLLWVRPGQVQRSLRPGTTDGLHLLFTAAFLPPFSGDERLVEQWYGPACRQLGTGPAFATVATLMHQLRQEYTRPAGTASTEIMQLSLAALLLHVDRLPVDPVAGPGQGGYRHAGGEVFARFRAEVERSYATTRRVEDYAHRLGYTVKTLTRACLDATGHPAKHVIDARVTLEAQRLLAHTDEPAALVGRRLGFTEATNFGKFFARHTGTSPAAFRRTHRGPGQTAVGP